MSAAHPRLLAAALAASAALAQSPFFEQSLGTDLNLGDDTSAQGLPLGFAFNYAGVAYTQISVCSNGFVVLGPTNTNNDYSPTDAELVSGPPRVCPLWNDMSPNAVGSGHVWFNAFPAIANSPARAVVTWANVFEYGTTNAVSFQVEFDAQNRVTVTYGPNAAARANVNRIIGMSPGGSSTLNPISFAVRPQMVPQDTFHETFAGTPAPTNLKLLWAPTNPGCVIADVNAPPDNLPFPGSAEVIGAGCPASAKPSLYELFSASNAVDVAGMDFTFLPNGQGSYVVIPGIAGPFFTGYANALNAGDDSTHPVVLPFAFPHGGSMVNDIVVSSNGFLTLGTVNPGAGCCNGSVSTMLSGESRIAGWWGDLNASTSGAGEVYADTDPATGEFVVTWAGVGEYSTTITDTFQIAFDASGMFKIRLQNVARGSHDFLVGYSYGHGGSASAADLSAITATDLGGLSLIEPLTLGSAPNSRPGLGLTYTMNLSGVSPAPQGNVAMLFLGFSELNPGLDLGAGYGAPGCTAFLLAGQNEICFKNIVNGAPTSFSIAVPSDKVFLGMQAVAQAASDDRNANAFGWKLSNGLRLTIGL
jgi:hypothetical protein